MSVVIVALVACLVGFVVGMFTLGLAVASNDRKYPVSPRAPERCRCEHQPWHHEQIVNGKGLPDLGRCHINGCECFDYRPEKVE